VNWILTCLDARARDFLAAVCWIIFRQFEGGLLEATGPVPPGKKQSVKDRSGPAFAVANEFKGVYFALKAQANGVSAQALRLLTEFFPSLFSKNQDCAHIREPRPSPSGLVTCTADRQMLSRPNPGKTPWLMAAMIDVPVRPSMTTHKPEKKTIHELFMVLIAGVLGGNTLSR
jgi:hypothetical protein